MAGGSRNEDPVRTTYTGVVLMETVRIALTYADLNGLDILDSDIKMHILSHPSLIIILLCMDLGLDQRILEGNQ